MENFQKLLLISRLFMKYFDIHDINFIQYYLEFSMLKLVGHILTYNLTCDLLINLFHLNERRKVPRNTFTFPNYMLT